MAKVTFNSLIYKAHNYYVVAGMTPEGAAALEGNQYAESAGFIPKRLEFLCVKRYKEKGIVYTDDTYTKNIDSGKISRAEFLSPMGRHYGYGLSQWTTSNRKAGLYDLARKKGVSIADGDMQLEYTVSELKKKFPKTFKFLCTTKNVKKASDYVLEHYESPKNWQNLSTTRADYAKQIYSEMQKGSTMGIDNIIAKEREYGNMPWLCSDARYLLNHIPKNVVEWVCEEYMTDEEKAAHPTYETTGGYLRVLEESESAQIWWDGLSKTDKSIIKAIPNFDGKIFEECTGIKIREVSE